MPLIGPVTMRALQAVRFDPDQSDQENAAELLEVFKLLECTQAPNEKSTALAFWNWIREVRLDLSFLELIESGLLYVRVEENGEVAFLPKDPNEKIM